MAVLALIAGGQLVCQENQVSQVRKGLVMQIARDAAAFALRLIRHLEARVGQVMIRFKQLATVNLKASGSDEIKSAL